MSDTEDAKCTESVYKNRIDQGIEQSERSSKQNDVYGVLTAKFGIVANFGWT